jgi:hypothetical protein
VKGKSERVIVIPSAAKDLSGLLKRSFAPLRDNPSDALTYSE